MPLYNVPEIVQSSKNFFVYTFSLTFQSSEQFPETLSGLWAKLWRYHQSFRIFFCLIVTLDNQQLLDNGSLRVTLSGLFFSPSVFSSLHCIFSIDCLNNTRYNYNEGWDLLEPLIFFLECSKGWFCLQAVDQQQRLSQCFDKLMTDVNRNLEPKNRDRFTQNLTTFRVDFRLK